MIKVYCDNCKKHTILPKSLQMDVFDVDEKNAGADRHERYNLALCPECHKLFRDMVKATGVEPSINPYG